MGRYFGTDGFRGCVGRALTCAHAFQIGAYLGARYCGERMLIGKDTRLSSDALEHALAAGASATGATVHLLGVVPTPAISYLVKEKDFAVGVMITASHNPFEDNGIKLFGALGEKMDDGEIEALEDWLDRNEPPAFCVGRAVGRIVADGDLCERYFAWICALTKKDWRGLRIGLDMGNGSLYQLASALFEARGCHVFCVGNAPNGENINLQCGATCPQGLRRLVMEKGLDIGFAFDGDGDRCIAVDAEGRVLDGDAILYLMATALADKRELEQNTVAVTVMSNMGLERALARRGISCERTPVGDRFVSACMREKGLALGGEQSGHIVFGAYASAGDGLLTALMLTDLLCEGKSLSARLADYRPFPQLLRSLPARDREHLCEDKEAQTALGWLSAELGVRGRLLVRPSGTEQAIRVMVEAEEEGLCARFADRAAEVLQNGGYLT